MTPQPRTPPADPGTLERILRAAAAFFHARGFAETSMREIAAAARIGKSSIYHYFRGKEEILFEILQHTVEMALAGLQTIASSDRPAAERLRLAVRHHIVTLVEDLDNVACFVEEGRALAPPHLEAHIATRDAYERCFRQIIEDGVRRGEFAPVDVRLAGFAILGMCNWTVRWFRPDGPWTPEEISRHFGDLAAAALGAAYPAAAGLGLAVEARSSLPRGEHGPAARQFTTPARGE